MEKKIDMAGYLHIGYGALILLVAVIVLISILGGGMLSGETEVMAITSGVATIIFIILVILALPSFIGGWALLKRKPWSRILVIVLSIIDLFSFPLGTIVGGYSLYVLMQDEARAELEGGAIY